VGADARGTGTRRVRLQPREVEERRRFNELRLATLRRDFLRLDLDPVLVGEEAAEVVHTVLLEWANARVAGRGSQ
jgi:hypothetical protein